MRLIDADTLIEELNNSHFPGASYVDAGISIAIGKVLDAPTIEPERKKDADNGCTFLTCKHGGFGDDACSKCRWAYRDMYEPDREGVQE